jgi:hypothetical protein
MGSACAVTVDRLSRRQVLQLGGAAVIAAAAPLALEQHGAPPPTSSTPAPLRRSTYLPLVGERFAVAAGASSVALRLDEVRGRNHAFALLFHGSPHRRLEQAVRRIAHPAIGAVDLLLVPAGTGRRGQDYEVVVNRSRS